MAKLFRFEAYIDPSGDVRVRNLDMGSEFTLDGKEGYAFAELMIEEFARRYPSAIKALEQRFQLREPQEWRLMQQNRRIYLTRMVWQLCACCFGELDGQPDYDGEQFHCEEPRGCRERSRCPWCGYSERNSETQLTICGMKRDWHFSERERQIARLIQSGLVRPEAIADLLNVSLEGIRASIKNMCAKVGVTGMAELLFKIKDERL